MCLLVLYCLSDLIGFCLLLATVTSEVPPAVKLYDAAVQEPLQEFLKLSAKIGGDVAELVGLNFFIVIKLQ